MLTKKVLVKFQYTSRSFCVFKSSVKRLYKDPDSSDKWILFSNTRGIIEKFYHSIRAFLDAESYAGDIIQITGKMYREQKLFHTDLFLNMDRVIDLDIAPTDGIQFDISGFDARGCLATRALGSAGWDNKKVRLVFSADFPDNVLAFVQERGRAGRWQGASSLTDEYIVCGSLWSYILIVSRLYRKDDGPKSAANETVLSCSSGLQSTQLLPLKDFQRQSIEDLNVLIIGLILPQECINCYVARLTANPYTAIHNQTVDLPPCNNACDYCLKVNKSSDGSVGFPLLNKVGVQFSFADMYHGSENKIIDMEMTVELLQKIRRYPDANTSFFKSSSKTMPTLKSVEQLILVLLVTNILKIAHRVITVDNINTDKFYLELVFGAAGEFNLQNEDC